MITKHTPGPWTCKPTEDGAYALNPSGAGWLRVPKDETWANADLIAAAPDLLDKLKSLIGYVQLISTRADFPDDLRQNTSWRFKEAMALVDRLEGGSIQNQFTKSEAAL